MYLLIIVFREFFRKWVTATTKINFMVVLNTRKPDFQSFYSPLSRKTVLNLPKLIIFPYIFHYADPYGELQYRI